MTGLPPGPRAPAPIQTLAMVSRPLATLRRCRDRHGPLFTLRTAGQPPTVVVASPDGVAEVFALPPADVRAGEANAVIEPIVGAGSLLVLDGPRHLAERRVVLPPLHGDALQRAVPAMREAAEREAATWAPGQVVLGREAMARITLDIALRVVFGVRDAAMQERLRRLVPRLLEAGLGPAALGLMAFGGAPSLRRLPTLRRRLAELDALLFEQIARRRTDPGADVVDDLLRARRDDGRPLEDREVRDELVTLLIAGHETTATALAWALERVCRHPTVLAAVREEVRAGGHELLDAVALETLRLRPPVPAVGRVLVRPACVQGWELPAGVLLLPSILLAQRDAAAWGPDPHAFRPERFLGARPPAGAFIPFGGSVRRCAGAAFAVTEMREVLRVVLRGRVPVPVRPEAERLVRRSLLFGPHDEGRVRF